VLVVIGVVVLLGLPTFFGFFRHHSTVPASWSQAGGNAQHTGQAPVAPTGVTKVRWVTTLGGHVGDPVVGADGLLYVCTSQNKLYALDAGTGTVRWMQRNITLTTLFAGQSPHPSRSSVTYAQMNGKHGMVYCGSDNMRLFAYDALTGRQLWTAARESDGFGGSPDRLALEPDGNLYCVYGGVLTAYNGKTGRVRWTYTNNVRNAAGQRVLTSIIGSPTLSHDGAVHINKDALLIALDPATGKARWKFSRGKEGMIATPVIGADGTVYVCGQSGNLYAVDGQSGKLKWTNTYPREQIQVSPAIDAAGTLYFTSNGGRLRAVDGATGQERWSVKTLGIFHQPLISADGRLYVAGCASGPRKDFIYIVVYAIDSQTGSILATSPVLDSGKSAGDSQLAVGPDGTLYVGTWRGKVYALK